MSDQILDIDQLSERAGRFRVNGKVFDYKRWDAFSLLGQKRMAARWNRLLEIEAMEPAVITEEIEAEYVDDAQRLLTELSSMTPEDATAVDVNKAMIIVTGFFMKRAEGALTTAKAMVDPLLAKIESTLANSSAGSRNDGQPATP